MKDWLKSNWLSVFAIILSVVALCRCEPFVFTESALNWVLGIVVAIIGIAVSVALVTQIWTAFRISPMIDEKVKDLKEDIAQTIKLLHLENKLHLTAHNAQENAQKFLELSLFNLYIQSSIVAINAFSKLRDKSYCRDEIKMLIDGIKNCKSINPNIGLNPKDKDSLIGMLDEVNVPTSKLVREIESLISDDRYPSIDETNEKSPDPFPSAP